MWEEPPQATGRQTPVALFLGAFALRDRECGSFTQPDLLAPNASGDRVRTFQSGAVVYPCVNRLSWSDAGCGVLGGNPGMPRPPLPQVQASTSTISTSSLAGGARRRRRRKSPGPKWAQELARGNAQTGAVKSVGPSGPRVGGGARAGPPRDPSWCSGVGRRPLEERKRVEHNWPTRSGGVSLRIRARRPLARAPPPAWSATVAAGAQGSRLAKPCLFLHLHTSGDSSQVSPSFGFGRLCPHHSRLSPSGIFPGRPSLVGRCRYWASTF